MPILNCTVTNCNYNKDRMCCKEQINVEGNAAEDKTSTACGSFKEGTDTYSNTCKCSSEPERKTGIACEAEKCTYNDNKNCTAGHVEIEGCNAKCCSETMCASFYK